MEPGFFSPTGWMKSPLSGSGKPDRFDRLPEKTGQIQTSNQKRQFNRFPPVSRPVRSLNRSGWVVTGVLNKKIDGFKVVPRCEINKNFGMSYVHINVKDHTKAIIYNHIYKNNSNKRAYKYHSHNYAYKYNSYWYTSIKVQRTMGRPPFGTSFGIRRWTSHSNLAL